MAILKLKTNFASAILPKLNNEAHDLKKISGVTLKNLQGLKFMSIPQIRSTFPRNWQKVKKKLHIIIRQKAAL